MFSSVYSIVSGLIFKPRIHFELICVCGIRQQSGFIVLPVASQFSQQHLLKRLFFLHRTCLTPCRLCSIILCVSLEQSHSTPGSEDFASAGALRSAFGLTDPGSVWAGCLAVSFQAHSFPELVQTYKPPSPVTPA